MQQVLCFHKITSATFLISRTLSSKEAINLDYLPYLRSAILEPLQSQGAEGANQSVKLMDDYDIIKEDVDNIMEISTWGGQPDPYSKLDSKVCLRALYIFRAYCRRTP